MKRFYVYDIFDADRKLIYVGKGTRNRMLVSLKERGGKFCEKVAEFDDERQAYACERTRIAENQPPLNRTHGGGGCVSTPARAWTRGLIRMLARLLRLPSDVVFNIGGIKIPLSQEMRRGWLGDLIREVGKDKAAKELARYGVVLDFA
jgi:hypothetical protein